MIVDQRKVFVICPDLGTASMADNIKKRDKLADDILEIADLHGEVVYLHDYKTPRENSAPVVLIECTERFHDKIRLMNGFGYSHELEFGLDSIRQVDKKPAPQPAAKTGIFGFLKRKGPK